MDKNLISANKCTVGQTYYLTGMWWDYGTLLDTVPLVAIGLKPKSEENIARCLINEPVKFNGRIPSKKSVMGARLSYEFERPDGKKIYSDASSKNFFKKTKEYEK